MKKPLGVKIWNLVPCASGFGEWESNGATFVRKDSIRPNPEIDGLIRNQTGKPVKAETVDGLEVVGMLVNPCVLRGSHTPVFRG